MDRLDFLAIGDITTDAFIRIKDATVNCDVDRKNCMLSMRFGDKIPYEFVEIVRAVGNSPNASVSAARLGLRSGIVTNVGDDQNGEECIEKLREERVDVSNVHVHPDMETNYHYVLWYEEERTILLKHQEYPYALPDITPPRWMYFSSMAENSLTYHEQVLQYLMSHPEVNLAFQPGTFQIKFGYEKLKGIYKRAEIFFCNKQEAKIILKSKEDDIKKLLALMHERGPKIVVITDGPGGAYAYDGARALFIPMYPDLRPPYERTGAGDAFSSTVVSALAQGLPLDEALRWGPINSMSVVQHIGAQKGLLSREKLEEYLREAPKDYKVSRI